jgi:CBS domain containing-hemolysin-like protein
VPDESAYETVGGYVMSQLGRIARTGDVVDTPGGTLTVTRMDGRRIDRICFHHVESDESTPENAENPRHEAGAV